MANRVRVVNAIPLPAEEQRRIAGVSDRVELITIPENAAPTLTDPRAEVLFTFVLPDFARMPRLRWIQLPSAGVEHVLKNGGWPRRVQATNARGVYTIPMAEYVMWGLLHWSQRSADRAGGQRAHQWPTDAASLLIGQRLRGRRLLVVGYGSTGREVARLASAFGMRVVAVRTSRTRREGLAFRVRGTGDPLGKIPERIADVAELVDVVRHADVVTVCLPLTKKTRGIISREVLAAMRPDALLINIGRGGLVDEEAALDALRAKRLRGAVLDVVCQEPLPKDHPLWDQPNVVITSHVSGSDDRSDATLTDLLCQNLTRYLSRRPLLNLVDPVREY